MTRLKLDFIHEFVDRHGKVRRYFRRRGQKRIPLPGLPGSEEFMSAYSAALDAPPERAVDRLRAPVDRARDGIDLGAALLSHQREESLVHVSG